MSKGPWKTKSVTVIQENDGPIEGMDMTIDKLPRYLSEQIDFPTGLIEGRQPKTGELIQTYLNRGHEGYKLFHMEKFPSNEWLFVWEKV